MTQEALPTILVGVNGSLGSARALKWAAARAAESGAELVAVHVLTYTREFLRDLPPIGFTNWEAALHAKLHGPWTEAGREDGHDLRCALVEDDSAADGLIAAAEREQAALIVVGADGHTGLRARLLGSTTYELTHRARQPIVLVPEDWQGVTNQPSTPITAVGV